MPRTTTASATRLAREATRLGALAAAVPGATAVTLAHRLPLLAGLGGAVQLTQVAELWRMTLEKPIAFWQAWLACAGLPLQVCSLYARGADRPDLALRLAAAGIGALHAGLAPIHARVTGNARRLSRCGGRARSRRRGARPR